MRSRHDGEHRTLPEFEATDPVQQSDPTDVGPPQPDFVGDGPKTRKNFFVVGLVVEVRHAIATLTVLLGMIANGSGEENHGPAVASYGPFVHFADSERIRGECEPVIGVLLAVHGSMVPVDRGRWSAREHLRKELHYPPVLVGPNDDPTSDDPSSESLPDIPPAPIPAHERMWRHPSEVGAATATLADVEPPLKAAGRGVVAASLLMGVAVVSALLIIARPTDGDADARDVIRLTSDDIDVASVGVADGDERPMAVLVNDGPLLITTSIAVGDRERITVRLTDGGIHEADVVHVDHRASVALLVLTTATDQTLNSIPDARAVQLGQEVIVLTETPYRLRVVSYDENEMLELGLADLDPDDVVEGAPVIDRAGRLVGLCTHTAAGIAVIPIELVAQALGDIARR